MLVIRQTETYSKWEGKLRDSVARAAIASRLGRVAAGLLGDYRNVGGGVQELRIHHGAGYRIYFVRRGPQIIILLCGGDKGSQQRDIELAKHLAERLEI
jgi:putative addiction module killer protein